MNVLISGASFAGLSAAYWMTRMGHAVTVVEIADGLRTGGTPVDIRNATIDIVRRMGIYDAIRAESLPPKTMEFRDADDCIIRTTGTEGGDAVGDDCEIERDALLRILFNAVEARAEFIFGNRIVELIERGDDIDVTLANGARRSFDLVLGCDGTRSSVRQLWFGESSSHIHFLQQYFSITIVDKLLIAENTTQMYNTPGKAVMLNAYNGKTDIVLCFHADTEIAYDYRDENEQRNIVLRQFEGQGWRTPALLEEVRRSGTFYFDKLCQVRMPSWTKGRVALVGDAGYCASPAAGMGGSLAIDGAAALANAFEASGGDVAQAFELYDRDFRPFIEEVQANAVTTGLEILVPRTEEAIRARNVRLGGF